MNKAIKWFDERLPIFSFMDKQLANKPTPKNLNYMWNFGSLAGVCLLLQIVTGIFLAMHYKPDDKMAFDSVQHIIRDVEWGWLIRNLHMVGASFFFIVVYIHILRGLYYGSYKSPREVLWWMGIIILFLMMATAFIGYVLPWGQMSYWGATVITNLLSVVPFIGDSIVIWLWGGYNVGDATLNRFFALHYLLPFVIVGVVFLHLWALWVSKSNNPTGIDLKKQTDWIPFHPYYTIKDIFGLGVFLIPFTFMVFFMPDFLGHTDNYIPADPLKTPPHIVPEWYFLPFYAILRAVPDKLLGVVAMFAAIAILFVLPWLDRSKVRSANYRPIYKQMFWLFLVNVFVLGWVGANPPEGHFVVIGQVSTALYFLFFLSLPWVSKYEKTKPLPTSL
jgi:ubiquinol-cytochrome c reductase cytochrome b subunit